MAYRIFKGCFSSNIHLISERGESQISILIVRFQLHDCVADTSLQQAAKDVWTFRWKDKSVYGWLLDNVNWNDYDLERRDRGGERELLHVSGYRLKPKLFVIQWL
jgi:hypothetical protein